MCGPFWAQRGNPATAIGPPGLGFAMGVARPNPRPVRGARPAQGELTPSRWRPGSSSPIKPVSRNATTSLHAHLEGCFGEAGPPRVAIFGPSVVTQLQR